MFDAESLVRGGGGLVRGLSFGAEPERERAVVTDGEVLEGDKTDRPDNCQCSPLFDDLPCWPCHRDGFDEPNLDIDG